MKTLRSQILALTALVVICLGAAAALLIQQAEATGRARTQAQLLDTTRALSHLIDARLEGYEQMLRALAVSEAMERRDFDAVDRQARAIVQNADAWIVLTDRSGQQLINTRLPRGVDLPLADLPADVLSELDRGAPRVCNLARGAVEQTILCVDLPIMRGSLAAYTLAFVFKPRLLQDVIASQKVPADRYATILDRKGVVVWRNVEPERFLGEPATPDIRKQLRAAPEGVLRSRSLDGVQTQAAFSRSTRSGWSFVVAVRESELSASSNKSLRDGGLIAGLLLIGALATATFIGRRISGDIAKLINATARIRRGEAPGFTDGQFSEFAELGEALNSAIAERDDLRERFAHAQEVGGIGSWEWHVAEDNGQVSDAWRHMHGLDLDKPLLRFRQVLAAVHPQDRKEFLKSTAEARRRVEPSDIEYRVLRADGSTRSIVARGRPVFGPDGRLVSALGIVRDVTRERDDQATMRRLNQLLEAKVEARTLERDQLWDLARDPFVVADDQGVWLEASPAWTTLLGYPLAAFLGRTSEWMEHPDDALRTRDENSRLADGAVTERFENRFRASDGTYRWLSWTAVPRNGRFYSVARDITGEKEHAESLRKAEEALREHQKLESIGQITGGIAHDFNNLLTPILGTLDFVQRKGLADPRAERLVSNAIEAAERARTLVQRLLAFARKQPLRSDAVDLAEGLLGVRPLLETALGPQIELHMQTSRDHPPVLADLQQLELALLNLAVNARDAMPNGGALRISTDLVVLDKTSPRHPKPGRYVQISVSDTGVGMPETVIARAIEPFFSTKGIGKGTGLGLSMIHGLMAQLGGGMDISSTLGAGTTVRLWLPLAMTPPAPKAKATQQPIETKRPTAGHALLVDDEALARASAAQMLAEAGYTVTEADSGEAALSRLNSEAFDLLVTDHLMPGMSGTELARVARRQWPSLAVLIISGYADVDDIAPDFPRLSKPFRQFELEQALASK